MRVCEYEDIVCPACKTDINLKEKEILTVNKFPHHKVICEFCNIVIYLPCED